MPSLSNHQSNDFTKLLLIGDAKTGKTGSLVSLVQAGYKLRILDFDNLLDILKYVVMEQCPDKIDNIEFRSLRDKRKTTPTGQVIDGQPKAFVEGMKMIDHWKYKDDDGTEIDLGKPAEWGPDCILVVDSLSRFCDAAFDFREPLAPKDGRGVPNYQAVYGDAQDSVEMALATWTGKSFKTNVIVIAHGQYMEQDDGKIKIFPQGVGQKLSPKIPQYFPSVVFYSNKSGKRMMHTTSTKMIDLANPAPFLMEDEYPIETGLAQFFEVLRPKPKKPTLVKKV